ncbi:putative A-kinase anchor protein 12-like [Scophthalmus maximus]|uniref:Putative A-kinase anchor protein 12-like n=1 Tax=Scophthalmus maximus TaxID=52904 RepID=A0A2U9BNK9_SCOMX|nr:putative A-kinase anchor protein 12-like [Scophthalmus maximus]
MLQPTKNASFLGLSTPVQSSSKVTLQGGRTLSIESELPPAEVVPVLAPPSLKEVHQAVQEASEQVEGRGAEEVLKELLERVVGAALGQVDGGSEVKADEGAGKLQEVVEEDALYVEKGAEAILEAKVLEQAVEKELEGEDIVTKEGYAGVGEKQEVAEVDELEDVAEKEKGITEGESETAAGSVEETTARLETGGSKADGVEVTNESLDTGVGQGVAEATLPVLEETGGDSAVEEAGVEGNNKQVESTEEKGAAEIDIQEAEETQATVEVAVDEETEKETVEESNLSNLNLSVADVEQLADVLPEEEAQKEETAVDELEKDETVLPSDNYEPETRQTAAGELVAEEKEVVMDTEGPEVEDKQDHLVVEGGAAEEVETEGTDVGEAAGGERDGESEIKEESVALVNEGGEQQAGEEVTLMTSHGSEKGNQEPGDGAEASIEQNTENQAPTPSPSLGGVEKGENSLGDEKSNHGNEIITPTDDLLPHNPDVAQPTLDNSVKDVLPEPPQAEGEEPGEVNELVEDSTGTTETSELGLEAWKIGAISAAVFLVLETTFIIIYILKCRNKKKIAALDPSDVASTLAPNHEQHEEKLGTALSDLPSGSREESANTGPGPDSSQDLRTSIL